MPTCHLRADCVDLSAPGNSSASRQLSRPNRSLPAITLPTSTKASLSAAGGAKAAMAEPTATPKTEGTAQARTTSIITAPLPRWVRNEITLVGTMIASEVPTQSWKRTSSGTPSARNTSYRTGTTSAPPPMPNRPARMPVTTPPAMIIAASSTNSLMGTPRIISGSEGGHGTAEDRVGAMCATCVVLSTAWGAGLDCVDCNAAGRHYGEPVVPGMISNPWFHPVTGAAVPSTCTRYPERTCGQ